MESSHLKKRWQKTEKIPENFPQQQTKIVRHKKAAMIGRWVLGVN